MVQTCDYHLTDTQAAGAGERLSELLLSEFEQARVGFAVFVVARQPTSSGLPCRAQHLADE